MEPDEAAGGGWPHRLERWVRRRPIVVLAVVVAFLFSTAFGVVDGAGRVHGWYEDRFRWREQRYEVLQNLRAGYSRGVFEEALGQPTFERQSDDGALAELSFRGRDHWVQAIVNKENAVTFYSVTSCSKSFNPSFELPDGGRVVLRQTAFSDVLPDRLPSTVEYVALTATANRRMVEWHSGGNTTDYKIFAWAISDACSYADFDFVSTPEFDALHVDELLYEGRAADLSIGGKRMRRLLVANTYAETSPDLEGEELVGEFNVGVDRLLTRTAPGFDVDEADPES